MIEAILFGIGMGDLLGAVAVIMLLPFIFVFTAIIVIIALIWEAIAAYKLNHPPVLPQPPKVKTEKQKLIDDVKKVYGNRWFYDPRVVKKTDTRIMIVFMKPYEVTWFRREEDGWHEEKEDEVTETTSCENVV